ncbi:MAG: SPOR domain-containing protein [Proteobacteria bacterium]|nr:SPOR domain-containing protein [Pseudomonadota bacterium]
MKPATALILALAWTLGGCATTIPATLSEAARQLETLFDLRPPDAPADRRLIERAAAEIADGDYAEADLYLDAAQSINPGNPDIAANRKLVDANTGRARRARVLRTPVAAADAAMAAPVAQIEPAAGADASESTAIFRFEILGRLLKAELMTPVEYEARRSANLGALLPLTGSPPSPALAHPAPPADDVIERLRALELFRGAGAISNAEHAVARAAILDALVPMSAAGAPAATPAGGNPEAQRDRLERVRSAGLISDLEYGIEREALDASSRPEPEIQAEAQNPPSPPEPGAVTPQTAAANPDSAGEIPLNLHLASFRTPERARRVWDELNREHADLFSGLSPRIARVNMGGDKGVFFQLSAGPVAGESEARALCAEIRRRRLYCEPVAL